MAQRSTGRSGGNTGPYLLFELKGRLMARRLPIEADRSVSSFVLYREDLDEILQMARVIGKDQVRITDREYSYDSPDDLEATRGTVIKELNIECSEPNFTFSMTRDDMFPAPILNRLRNVFLHSHSKEGKALCDDIVSLLRARRRKWIGSVFNGAFVLPLCILGIGAVILAFTGLYKELFLPLGGVTLAVAYIVWNVRLFDASGGFSKIVLRRRAETSEGFLAQYREHIILVVTSVVLTFVITRGCDYVWGKMASGPQTEGKAP